MSQYHDHMPATLPVPGAPGAPANRLRVRHSFDVFADQLLSLREIALAREARDGLRVRLGDVVQEALDAFIARTSGQRSEQAEGAEQRAADLQDAAGLPASPAPLAPLAPQPPQAPQAPGAPPSPFVPQHLPQHAPPPGPESARVATTGKE